MHALSDTCPKHSHRKQDQGIRKDTSPSADDMNNRGHLIVTVQGCVAIPMQPYMQSDAQHPSCHVCNV